MALLRDGRLQRSPWPFGFASCDHDSQTLVDSLSVAEISYPEGRGHFIMDNLPLTTPMTSSSGLTLILG